jgi:single-strand DNA-binding protein
MNQVTLIGRITKDLQIEAAGQHKVLRFSVAINNGKDKDATFINCQAWNKTAELIGQYFAKGSRIGILGRLDVSKYENKEGKTVHNTYVTVNSIEFIDQKSDKPKEVHEVVDVEFDYGTQVEISPDDLPF